MDISEEILTILAILFELGIPFVIITLCILRPRLSNMLLPILGSVTPLLVFYFWCSFSFLILGNEDAKWAFYTQWVMSFFAYFVLLLIGFSFALITRKLLYPVSKFFVGLVVGPGIAFGVLNLV